MNAPGAISRRALFRGRLATGSPDRGRWHRVDEIAAGSGDVFWSGWADESGVFVVGDDGAILHYDGLTWERSVSPAPVPIT